MQSLLGQGGIPNVAVVSGGKVAASTISPEINQQISDAVNAWA